MRNSLSLAVKVALLCILLLSALTGIARDTSKHSTQQQALAYLSGVSQLEKSRHWPNVSPTDFLENLRLNAEFPMSLYAGRGTNFCSYAALSYIPLHNDPLGFVQFMVNLYKTGKGTMGSVQFRPSHAVQKAAGTIKFKGKMDTRPADQMWLLILADHFKGYLNILNRNYDPGDEDRFWAVSNYAKFNRMVRKLFNYSTVTSGTDLFRPRKKDLAGYLMTKLDSGVVFLYVNNTLLAKKDHGAKKRLPSHFIVLQNITVEGDLVTITYLDNGARTLQQVSRRFLKKITFGVTYATRKT